MGDMTVMTRRAAVATAAAMGAAAVAGATFAVPALASSSGEGVGQYGFLVRTENCVNCQECVAACRKANGTPEGVAARRKVEQYVDAAGHEVNISTGCMHCAEPACAEVCPANAITKGEGGIVVVDEELCIGCKYCYQACPFAVPHYTSVAMDKCDCCLGNGVPLGDEPHCVQACSFGALHYGPLDELLAGSQGRATQIDCPTGPSYLIW